MKIKYSSDMTFSALEELITTRHPEYETVIKKNPLARFKYIQVKKSGTVGIWIRIFENKGHIQLINTMPSSLVRAFLGGLLLVAFTHKAQTKVRNEIGNTIITHYNTASL